MHIEYKWSAEIEAAARAIAAVEGWNLSENAFSVIAIPRGRAAAYWIKAVAAVSAHMAAAPELSGEHE